MEFLMILIFWVGIAIVFYAYLGYGIVLFFFKTLKNIFQKREKLLYEDEELPEVTMIVAAYNEEYIIEDKVKNSLAQDYPSDRLKLLFVTDGSNDATPEIIKKFPGVALHHKDERKGKLSAVERVMPFVSSEIIVFTDANTFLNKKAVKNLVKAL